MTLKYYVGNTRYTDLPTERLISMQRQVIKSKDVNNTKPGFLINKVEGNIRAGMFDVGAMVGIHYTLYIQDNRL